MQEIIVTSNEAGQRFDKLLAKFLNEAPKSFIYKMLRKKNIILNGKKASGNEKLQFGDQIKLFLSDETIAKFSKKNIVHTDVKLDILYEDANILVINKPVGMLSQKANAADESLNEHIISYLLNTKQLTEADLKTFKPSICNRLDRNTSGLIVAGKTLLALQKMGDLFRERQLKKYYQALVGGSIAHPQYLKGYLSKDSLTNTVTISQEPTENSLPIETEYTPIWTNGQLTLLEVHLITGKTHQIRAHLASCGHPIVGDYKYGNRQINDKFKETYNLQSQFLHSYRLEMPKLADELEALSDKQWIAPLPQLFLDILKAEAKDSQDGNMEF